MLDSRRRGNGAEDGFALGYGGLLGQRALLDYGRAGAFGEPARA